MKKVKSTQVGIHFLFCTSPITIDKSGSWGPGNFQKAPNGAFLKLASETEISHLVQPNDEKTAPIGWVTTDKPGFFDKVPIWVDEENLLQPDTVYKLKTADGDMEYKVTKLSLVCYNDKDSTPNLDDGWVQTVEELEKNYQFNLNI